MQRAQRLCRGSGGVPPLSQNPGGAARERCAAEGWLLAHRPALCEGNVDEPQPTLEEARALAAQGNLCPLYAEVPADLETPVSAYLKVARGSYSFLLESVEGGERLARYSFIGTEPYRTLRSGEASAATATPATR